MITVSKGNAKVNIPSKWEELSPDQFATILEVLGHRNADKYTIGVSVLALLFGAKNYSLLRDMDDEELHCLMPLCNFIFDSDIPLINFYQTLKVDKKTLYAPSLDLSTINFGEWCFAYQMWEFFVKSKDLVFLDKLIAIIYRPKNKLKNALETTGDIRESFNENSIELRAALIAKLELKTKQAIFAWFNTAITMIMVRREKVFPKSEVQEETPETQEAPGNTFLTIFRELLGAKWGTTEVLKSTNAMFVLDYLEEARQSSNSQSG
jgi:hypothetical protein